LKNKLIKILSKNGKKGLLKDGKNNKKIVIKTLKIILYIVRHAKSFFKIKILLFIIYLEKGIKQWKNKMKNKYNYNKLKIIINHKLLKTNLC
jgi:hypothetical protein